MQKAGGDTAQEGARLVLVNVSAVLRDVRTNADRLKITFLSRRIGNGPASAHARCARSWYEKLLALIASGEKITIAEAAERTGISAETITAILAIQYAFADELLKLLRCRTGQLLRWECRTLTEYIAPRRGSSGSGDRRSPRTRRPVRVGPTSVRLASVMSPHDLHPVLTIPKRGQFSPFCRSALAFHGSALLKNWPSRQRRSIFAVLCSGRFACSTATINPPLTHLGRRRPTRRIEGGKFSAESDFRNRRGTLCRGHGRTRRGFGDFGRLPRQHLDAGAASRTMSKSGARTNGSFWKHPLCPSPPILMR